MASTNLQRVQQAIDQCSEYAAKMKVPTQPENHTLLSPRAAWPVECLTG